jgi:hypothetical protein
MEMPGQEISATVNGTCGAKATGTTEGGVLGATDGGWEGIAAEAFARGVELDPTAATELTVMGDAELDLTGKTQGGVATIPSIQCQVPERHTHQVNKQTKIHRRSSNKRQTERKCHLEQTDTVRNRKPGMAEKLPDSRHSYDIERINKGRAIRHRSLTQRKFGRGVRRDRASPARSRAREAK